MSLLNFSFRKKTSQSKDTAPFCGFKMGENSVHDSWDALFHCLIKGLLIFTSAFGCVSGVLSEFDIAYNYLFVLVIIFVFSMLLSLMHIKKWIFNIGYPVLFILFSTMLIRYRMFVNSGFQALLNIVNESYSAHFLMLFTRESTEVITDRYLTITAAIIFIGIFLAILINVGIFNDMYFLTVFNLTFWPLQLGIYIGRYPSFLSLGLLFFSYFAIYFLKHSGHYQFIYPEKKPRYTRTYKRKDTKFVFHKSNARNMAQLCAFALIVSLFFSAFGIASIPRSEQEAFNSSPLKESADQYVKIFVQNGFSGFFNRYEATGGISNGRLGGVSSVRPDYQTDLIATFVPYAYETLYLKAFVGMEYTGSSWQEPGRTTLNKYRYSTSAERSVSENAFTEAAALSAMMEDGRVPSMTGTMIIENVDAAPNHLYLPYYTSEPVDHSAVTVENILDGSLVPERSVSIRYVPYSPAQTDLDRLDSDIFVDYRSDSANTRFQVYSQEVYDNYLQIPDEVLSELMKYHTEIGSSSNLSEQIFLIRQFLTANYSYSMTPGTTPRNEDFVTYFLNTQKEGYCAHFASAATLLFRSYGIPARYVEGYIISQTAISDRALAAEYDYDDFFSGENILENSNVIEVEINDGDAHAWVEVFVDGFGWIPVDATPPSQDAEETTYSDFLSALSGLFDANTATSDTNENDTDFNDLFSSLQFQNSPVIILFLTFLALALLMPALLKFIRSIISCIKRRQAYKRGQYDICIAYAYRKYSRILRKKYPQENLKLPEAVGCFTDRLLALSSGHTALKMSAAELTALTQKACFDKKQLPKEAADSIINAYKILPKLIK